MDPLTLAIAGEVCISPDAALPESVWVDAERVVKYQDTGLLVLNVQKMRNQAPEDHYLYKKVESRRQGRRRIADSIRRIRSLIRDKMQRLEIAKALVVADGIAADIYVKLQRSELQEQCSDLNYKNNPISLNLCKLLESVAVVL